MNTTNVQLQEYNKFLSTIKKQYYVNECFHEDTNCSQIIRAHSIQNNRILKKISDNGDVLYPRIKIGDSGTIVLLEREGRKKATTFTGFCKYHDNFLFTPIEHGDYKKGDKEQEFLFAYRAFAKEYHAEKVSINSFNSILEESIESIELTQQYRQFFQHLKNNREKVLSGLVPIKKSFNDAIKEKNFDIIHTRSFEFFEEYHLAASSVLTIENDLQGGIINDFTKINENIKYYRFLYLTVFPQEGKTYILLSFLKKDKKAFSSLMNQIQKSSLQRKKVIISNILAINAENLAVSPKKWCQMSESQKLQFIDLFEETSFQEGDSMTRLKNVNLFI